MIERLRQRLRRPMADQWLLLSPADGNAWRWQHWCDGGVHQAGDWPAPAELQALPCALLLPATACSQFEVMAPPGIRPSEWPLLLEDRLLQPLAEVQVACLGRFAGRLRLLAVERTRLETWQQRAAELGLKLSGCWSEYQLLPEVGNGQALAWLRPGYRCIVQRDDDGQPSWFTWPDTLADSPLSASCERYEPSRTPLQQPLARLPGIIPTRSSRPRLSVSPGTMGLLALCVVLALVWLGTLFIQTRAEGTAAREWLAARLGNAVSLARVEAQLRQRQRNLQDDAFRQQQLASLEAALASWLEENPEARLQSLAFDGRYWTLTLRNPGPHLNDAQRWQTLATQLGIGARLEERAGQVSLRFDLDAGGDT
jgi:general secretion pathway protein L